MFKVKYFYKNDCIEIDILIKPKTILTIVPNTFIAHIL